jgi:hypothetical protein
MKRLLCLTEKELEVYYSLITNIRVNEDKRLLTTLTFGWTKDSRRYAVKRFTSAGLIKLAPRTLKSRIESDTSGLFFFLADPNDLVVCKITGRKEKNCSREMFEAVREIQTSSQTLTINTNRRRSELIQVVARKHEVPFLQLKEMISGSSLNLQETEFDSILFQAEIDGQIVWILSWPGLEYFDFRPSTPVISRSRPDVKRWSRLLRKMARMDLTAIKPTELDRLINDVEALRCILSLVETLDD